MSGELSLEEMTQEWHGSLKSYLLGLGSSLVLTVTSFALVVWQLLPMPTLIYAISGIALVQAVAQMFFFLHLGGERKPKWNTAVFLSMLIILFIIVAGSLWIMFDLNERMMPENLMEMPHD